MPNTCVNIVFFRPIHLRDPSIQWSCSDGMLTMCPSGSSLPSSLLPLPPPPENQFARFRNEIFTVSWPIPNIPSILINTRLHSRSRVHILRFVLRLRRMQNRSRMCLSTSMHSSVWPHCSVHSIYSQFIYEIFEYVRIRRHRSFDVWICFCVLWCCKRAPACARPRQIQMNEARDTNSMLSQHCMAHAFNWSRHF